MLKQRQQLFASLLVAADAALIAAASYAAWILRIEAHGRWWPESWENYFKEPFVAITVPAVLAALWMNGLYKPRRDKSILGEMGLVLRATTLATGLLIVFLWATGAEVIEQTVAAPTATRPIPENLLWASNIDPARLQFGALAVFLFAFVGLWRFLFRKTLRALRRRGWNQRYVAIVGTGRLGQIACRTIGRNSWTGANVSYFVSHHEQTRREYCARKPVVAGLSKLEAILEERPVDAVYLCLPASKAAMVPVLLRRLERFALDVRIVPDVHPRYLPGGMAVSELEGMPILSYRESPIYGVGGIAKRIIDILGSIVGILLFSPVMLLIAILIRVTGGPGRVIFKQRRMGIGGEVFKIYKFRTMRAEQTEEERSTWTKRDDPRIFAFGRFLRNTSLDELPQLINVLSGRMSLVGPRPERPELVDQFRDDWRGYMLRQHVKSGMTGWAQVNGLRGNTSLKKRLQYDLFYIRNWSLLFDIRILWMTIFKGFINPNAH